MILEIEPVPKNSWGLSLAHKLSKDVWNTIRHTTYRNAGYKCQVCGDDDRYDLSCHEIWKFDDAKLIQTLLGFECCCSLCHNVHHLGRSRLVYDKTYVNRLIRHWCEVNEKTIADFQAYEIQISQLNVLRSGKIYKVIVFGRELK